MGFPQSPAFMPPSRENASITVNKILASFCGRIPTPKTKMSNWLEIYDLRDNSWSHIGFIPGLEENHVLKGFAMVSINVSIYIIGGKLCRKELRPNTNDEVDEIDIEVRQTVLRFDVPTKTWSTCAPMATPRFNFACTVCNGKVYVAGGQCMLAGARGISLAEVYDPTIDSWARLPNMNTLRYNCVGVTWKGKIYVVGGFAGNSDSDAPNLFDFLRSSAEVIEPCGEVWNLKLGMWQLDIPPNQIVSVDDKLLSSGDCLNAWKGHIEAYNVNLNIWNMVEGSHSHTLSSSVIKYCEDCEGPNQRVYLTMAPIGTHLYFLAAYKVPGSLPRSISVVHAFDTSTTNDPWRSFKPILQEEGNKELCGHCCPVQV